MSPMSSKLLHKGLALLCVAAVHSGCGVQHAVTSRTDGVECPQIETLRPDQVHSVRVLKDAAASAYGSRGANGVILITTKVAHEAAERERENKQNR